jgi:hypothetical protein
VKYRVYNERNVVVTVTEQQLEQAQTKNGRELPLEFLNAMVSSRREDFVHRLREALYHPNQRARVVAVHGLLARLNPAEAPYLRDREKSLPPEDFAQPISEKGILQAALLRLERGPRWPWKLFLTTKFPF